MNKGKLITVKLKNREGAMVKMYEADAIAQGLLPGKARPQAPNKMLKPADNKVTPEPEKPAEKPPADDFTTIPGVGPATARALVAHGIATFEQIKAAGDLDYLTAKARDGIAAWRANG